MKVRLYVEGGPKGTHANGLRLFRNSFKQHLMKLDPKLRAMDVSPCGSTEETIRDYSRAIRENRGDAIESMLVDSDTPVTTNSPAEHLRTKLESANVPKEGRANVFMMVQCMESWFVTDAAALKMCFGNELREKSLPANIDIEAVPKTSVLADLNTAVQTTPAGSYHKIRHGAKILSELKPDTVAKRSRHARELHTFLCDSIRG